MDVRLEVEDLPFPATTRVVHDGVLSVEVKANQEALRRYGTRGLADVADLVALDEWVVEHATDLSRDVMVDGHLALVDKRPVTRDGQLVAVLTVLSETSAVPAYDRNLLGYLADSGMEAVTLLELRGGRVFRVDQNRARQSFDHWLESEMPDEAKRAGAELQEMALSSTRLAVPREIEFVVGDRHFMVRNDVVIRDDVIVEPDDPPLLISQTMVDVSDRSRSLWLEHLVEVAASPTVASATKRTFDVLNSALGFDRGALLRIDHDSLEIVASTLDVVASTSLQVAPAVVASLRLPGVTRLPSAEGGKIVQALKIDAGALISVHSSEGAWGTLVVGDGKSHPPVLTELTVSMLESLGSTLGMVIERETARERLQESNRRLEAYAHAAAHDLRSPLRRIRSFSQILEARLDDDDLNREQLSDYASRIAGGAERLDALLESMLEHATIGTLGGESNEYSDLQAIVEEICAGVIELSHDPKPCFVVEGLPVVRLPRDAAERIFRNLIDNALKHSPDRRTVELRLTTEVFGEAVRVRVADNGDPLSPSSSDEIFGLFNRLSDQTPGSGVGLTVVERLLATRGAGIWVDLEVREGVTFVIDFPASVVRSR